MLLYWAAGTAAVTHPVVLIPSVGLGAYVLGISLAARHAQPEIALHRVAEHAAQSDTVGYGVGRARTKQVHRRAGGVEPQVEIDWGRAERQVALRTVDREVGAGAQLK